MNIERDTRCDVAIVGGGLAGLTLALELHQRFPQLRVLVLERRAHPVPEAAFKVGESTVEIAAWYFASVLGLREHLDAEQIVKFGFRFFFSDGRDDIDRCTELGASEALPTGAWQIDRGRFENFLGQHARALGIDFVTAAQVTTIELSEADAPHRIEWTFEGATYSTNSRWLVDASGRAGMLKRRLGLAQDNGHRIGAVWLRVDHLIELDAWSDDAPWQLRVEPRERWRSTNHLCGPGYWVWLIPLASGSHSIGVVFDSDTHVLDDLNDFDKLLAWLRRHQPRLAKALEGREESVQDFAFFRHVSYGCHQMFSDRRWALTGEAGAFLDPFYSPGSDFIAIANRYVCELIGKDFAGDQWQPYVAVYESLFQSFYDSTLMMYRDQYHLFGDAQVLPLKVLWDYSYYWGVLAALYFADRIADLPTLSRLRPELAEAKALNASMQHLLGDWGRRNANVSSTPSVASFLDQADIAWFAQLNSELRDRLDTTTFRARLRENVARLRALAVELAHQAQQMHPSIDVSAFAHIETQTEKALLPPHWRVDASHATQHQ